MKNKLVLLFIICVVLFSVNAHGVKQTSTRKSIIVDRAIIYAHEENETLKMTLYRPADSGQYPVVVLVHGGGWLIGTRWWKSWYGHRLAENGYIAATIDYRMLPRNPFPACLHDCKAAIRWLRLHADEYGIDSERIGVLGDSAGGHLALFLGVTLPSDGLEGATNPGASSAVQAVVSLYGVADLTDYEPIIPRDKRDKIWLFRKFVGDESRNSKDPYAAASPITYVHSDMCPILLVHGTKDRMVPYRQSQRFYQRTRASGSYCRLVSFSGKGHGFDYFRHGVRACTFRCFLDFFNQHLHVEVKSDGTQARQ